ncbi:MAG: LamG domain-containing protein, partial [Chloroflexi bacterium]
IDAVNNRINLTSGIIYDIKLSDGTHYKCDEGAGTTAFDSSGNGHHGTMYNITESTFHATDNRVRSWQNEVGYNDYVFFNSTNGAMLIDDASVLANCTDATIEFKIYRGKDDDGLVFTHRHTNGIDVYFALYHPGQTSNSYSSNIYKSGQSRILVDGVQIGNARQDLANALTVGQVHTVRYEHFDLSMMSKLFMNLHSGGYFVEDDFIFDVKLDYTSDGVWEHHWPLIGHFDDVIGGLKAIPDSTIYLPADQTGSSDIIGNPLYHTGRVKYNADLVQSACATFDGVDDYADLPAPPFDANGTNWTVGCWFRTTDNFYRLIDWRGTGTATTVRGVQISKSATNTTFANTRIDTGAGNEINFAEVDALPYIDGNWHHIMLGWDSSTGTAYLYLDGNLALAKTNSALVNADLTSQPGIWRLGAASNDGSQQFQGSACGFIFYNILLSASEIAELYSTGFVSGVTPAAYYPLAEGAGTTLYDVSGNNLHATLYNISESSFWANTQDVFHYNINKGSSLYTHATNNDLRVPYDLNGHPLSITPPSGYSLASENPAGNWHNNAETKIQMMAGDANLAAGTFWMDSAGTLQARSYNDIVGIWNNEN